MQSHPCLDSFFASTSLPDNDLRRFQGQANKPVDSIETALWEQIGNIVALESVLHRSRLPPTWSKLEPWPRSKFEAIRIA